MSKDKATPKSNVKKRNWGMVLYPDSAPENWRDILRETGLPIAISPLHDKDIDPTGEPKKAHHHILLCYSGPTTFNVVKALTDKLNQPIPQYIEAIKGNYRYFSHKDNPDKAQYSEDDIEHLNGFNISDFAELTRGEVFQVKRSIIAIIREQQFTEYSDLIFYLEDSGLYGEMEVATNHTIFFDAILRSCRHSRDKSYSKPNLRVDPDTGEILEGGDADDIKVEEPHKE